MEGFLFCGKRKFEDPCFAENGNLPIFMADNVKIVYISADFGLKKSDGNGYIIEGRKTKNSNVIITDI